MHVFKCLCCVITGDVLIWGDNWISLIFKKIGQTEIMEEFHQDGLGYRSVFQFSDSSISQKLPMTDTFKELFNIVEALFKKSWTVMSVLYNDIQIDQ